MRHSIKRRMRVMVNTDPQRRCYNGCNFSEELRWTDWEEVEYDMPTSTIDKRLKFWRELNDYAVSQRGESARAEYRVEEVET